MRKVAGKMAYPLPEGGALFQMEPERGQTQDLRDGLSNQSSRQKQRAGCRWRQSTAASGSTSVEQLGKTYISNYPGLNIYKIRSHQNAAE